MKTGDSKTSGVYENRSSSAVRVANGFTNERPSPTALIPSMPENGMIRFNAETQRFEAYINDQWTNLISEADIAPSDYVADDSENVTRSVLNAILGQLFKSTGGSFRIKIGGGLNYDHLQASEVDSATPMPDWLTLESGSFTYLGMINSRGENYIYGRTPHPCDISFIIDLPKFFKMPIGPTLTISGGGGTGASAKPIVKEGKIVGVTNLVKGTGFTSAPTITVNPGTKYQNGPSTGEGAELQASINAAGQVEAITVIKGGKEYSSNQKYNYDYKVVSGFFEYNDENYAGVLSINSNLRPMWTTPPTMDADMDTDPNYGKFRYQISATILSPSHNADLGFRWMCNAYKFKNFGNLG